ncbi:MAG TPA: DUF192 domain-containing protein [Gallionellaceae bacterium]
MRCSWHAGKVVTLICGMALISAAHAETITLSIGRPTTTIQAEVAYTRAARERGLMQRSALCEDCGMLFVFPDAGRLLFWMKDTPLPLSIAFIAADGHIINIEEMQPDSTDIHIARDDALYALEMNRGWFARHGIRPGDRVDGLRLAPVGQ